MDITEPIRWVFELAVPRIAGGALFRLRHVRASATEKLLRPTRPGDLRLVLTSVPVPTPSQSPNPLRREFNYFAGLNEVQFAWQLHDVLRRLVPPGHRLLPIAYSKQMIVEAPAATPTANRDLWGSNLVVSGSTKYNDATRDLHDPKAGLRARLVFAPDGGVLTDTAANRQYRTERRRGGEITADHGVLARYWNLYDEAKTVVLIAGVESVFQLGVTQALANSDVAKRLLQEIRDKLGGRLPNYYEALLKVPALGLDPHGRVEVLAAYEIEWPDKTTAPSTTS